VEIAGMLESFAVDIRYPKMEICGISAEDAEAAYESALEIPYLIGLY
jgi:hypothetical protein